MYFGMPGTSFWELFGALGVPWTLSCAKCVLKAGLGYTFYGFWLPSGSLGQTFFDIFGYIFSLPMPVALVSYFGGDDAKWLPH